MEIRRAGIAFSIAFHPLKQIKSLKIKEHALLHHEYVEKESFNHPYTFVAAQTGLDEKTVRDIRRQDVVTNRRLVILGTHNPGQNWMETLGQFWMAINMGGMLSALVLTLLVLPAVYLLWKQGKVDE